MELFYFRRNPRVNFGEGWFFNFHFLNAEIRTRADCTPFPPPAALFGLLVDQARDLSQALAVAAAADHIGHATLGPKQRAIIILPGIAHLRGLGCRARGVDREALAR